MVGAFRSRRVLERWPRFGRGLGRIFVLAGLLSLLLAATASAFDYDRYKPADLDAIAARKAPSGMGADIFPVRSHRFDVTLAAQATPCATKFLKWAMATSGIPKDFINTAVISRCIQVKSAKGRVFTMYVQDVLTAHLEKEVPKGGKLTLYAALIYFDQDGPGILVNEFTAKQDKPGSATTDCGCGIDQHSGDDLEAKPGTPIPVAEDGIVVKVEENEQATVDVPNAGPCGRYVVVKHTSPDGRALFTRYTHLGRVTDKAGKPIAAGMQVKKGDRVGEVGSKGRFHYEVRPAEAATMDSSARWTQLYGAEPGMEWSRYAPVDPQTFKTDMFSKNAQTPAPKK